jgi:alkylhydroperoxidase family enzyme
VVPEVQDDRFAAASRRELLGLRPELAAEHQRLLDSIWEHLDPVLLELCRLRMATLMGATSARAERSPAAGAAGITEDLIGRLPAWPGDPAFSDAHRTALAFTEQLVVDHHGVTDDHVAALEAAIGADGVVVLTTALGVWDNQHRIDVALGVVGP